MNSWILNTVQSIEVMSLDGKITHLLAGDFYVEYRKCHELEKKIICGAVLKSLCKRESEQIRTKIDHFRKKRKNSQPSMSNAGCIFKNPKGSHAGQLIDSLGLKGLRIGGAEVSHIHGNFIINRGNATSEDIIRLISKLHSQVYSKTFINLEPEVMLLGQSWPTFL